VRGGDEGRPTWWAPGIAFLKVGRRWGLMTISAAGDEPAHDVTEAIGR
jgi:hypothetical protein